MTQHVDELAELYALGLLDEAENARVNRHAVECDVCASRIGEAESAVAALERHAPAQHTPAPAQRARAAFRWPVLAAAAFLIGLLPSLWLWSVRERAGSFDADRAVAVQAMVSTHFAHAQFVATVPDAPKAKLIYSRSGTWVFAVAETSRALTLRAVDPAPAVTLGTLHVAGNAAELFVARPPAARSYGLFEGEREIERVTLPRR